MSLSVEKPADASSDDFFRHLPEIERFADVADPKGYADAPASWLVVLTDVRGSTRAIEQGRYKDVNALGVASIIALRNAASDLELPYVFGGDGATLLVPGSRRDVCESALRAVRTLATSAFDLELRVGVVSVAELARAGHPVRVARFRASPHVCLAMFRGSGISEAERWVKSPDDGPRYHVGPEGPTEASFEGFECRWQPVPSQRGHVLSLIVLAVAEDDAERAKTYRRTIDTLESALEEDAGHPISLRGLRLGTLFGGYATEARVKSQKAEGEAFDVANKLARKQSLIGRALIGIGGTGGSFDGSAYPAELIRNTDFRKFDEALRMVLDVSDDQLAVIEGALKDAHEKGEICFGVHRASSALITCFVRSYAGDHVHFVDGANGGYALAAKKLKAQVAERKA